MVSKEGKMKKILALIVVAGLTAIALNVFDAGATSINRRNESITVTQSGTVSVSQADSTHKYMCYSVCPPASKTTARAIDHATGQYFEAVWTVVHPTNTDGCVTVFDLSAGAVVDSLTDIRLLAGMTYSGDEIVGDSIAVFIWDVDDTCYLFGRGTYPYRRDWDGD